MRTLKITQLLLAGVACLSFSACNNDDDTNQQPLPDTSNVYYIVNEGSFNSGNGNITFYNTNADTQRVEVDFFRKVNNRALGDVVQSLGFANGLGYIVVNGSSKVEVVDSASFASLATITSVSSPRYFKAISASKGYLTDWFSNSVQIINLNDFSVTGTINTGAGPEQIVVHNQQAYISNTGGYANDSIVSVINTATDAVETNIQVGIKPSAMHIDRNNNLWVLCTGQYGGFNGFVDKAGSLVKINTTTNEVELTLPMPAATDHPTVMAMSPDRDFLYFVLNDKVFRMNIADTQLPTEAFITKPGTMFYGLAVSAKNGDIVTTEAAGSSTGRMYIFNSNGNDKGSLSSGGHFPNGVVVR